MIVVPKKADEDSVIVKSGSVAGLLSCLWHWVTCFSYVDPRLDRMPKLTGLVNMHSGSQPTQSGPAASASADVDAQHAAPVYLRVSPSTMALLSTGHLT